MVLVVEKKFLEEDWWKYGLALALLQTFCWILLGLKLNPVYDIWVTLRGSYFVYGGFWLMAFLPFVVGRLQLRRLFWFGFIGYLLSLVAYYTLSLMKVGESYNLLPFIAFLQVYTTCFGLGVIVELGRYVFRKLEE